jgi:hypothetical protein
MPTDPTGMLTDPDLAHLPFVAYAEPPAARPYTVFVPSPSRPLTVFDTAGRGMTIASVALGNLRRAWPKIAESAWGARRRLDTTTADV